MPLEAAIENAIKQEDSAADKKGENTAQQESSTEQPGVEQEQNQQEQQEDQNFGLSEAEQIQARQLFAALKDPVLSQDIIKIIAEKGGYTKQEVKELKQEIKSAQTGSDIQKILNESLEGMPWLAEKLAPALEKIVNQKISEQTSELRERSERIELNSLEAQAEKSFAKIAKDFYGKSSSDGIPDNVYNTMNKLMDEVPPAPGMSMDRYLTILHNSAVAELGINKSQSGARQLENKPNIPSRVSGGTRAAASEASTKTKGLTQAIQAAIDSVEADLGKPKI